MDVVLLASRTSGEKTQVPRQVHAFTAVFLIWVLGYALTRLGAEPYPAIVQPSFGYVADAGDVVEWTEIQYLVVFDDGRTQKIDYRDFFADAGGKAEYLAVRVMTPEVVADPGVVEWVAGRLEGLDLDGEPVKLVVQVFVVSISDDLGDRVESGPYEWATVDLQ